MRNIQQKQVTRLHNIVSFCEANSADFAETSSVPAHVVNLKRIIGEIDAAEVAQVPTGAVAKAALIDDLWIDIRNIARTAAAVAQHDPGFDERFILPHQM